MIERRIDHATRKRVSEMSLEEMRRALLISEKTGLPNRRAFDEGQPSAFVAMSDVNGLKALNDKLGYAAGDILIRSFADLLESLGLDAYHDKGDEFLCVGVRHTRFGYSTGISSSRSQADTSRSGPLEVLK